MNGGVGERFTKVHLRGVSGHRSLSSVRVWTAMMPDEWDY